MNNGANPMDLRDASDSEVLGTWIGNKKLAERILKQYSLRDVIFQVDREDLLKVRGIGLRRVNHIMAFRELMKRAAKSRVTDLSDRLSQPERVYDLMLPIIGAEKKENFYVLALNNKNRLIKPPILVSVGALTNAIVHPREVFVELIKAHAAAAIVVHNHPSGDPEPSREDIDITKRLMWCSNVVGIDIHDHIVIGSGGFVSMRRQGHMS